MGSEAVSAALAKHPENRVVLFFRAGMRAS